MTATAKIQSLAKNLRKRGHHGVDHDPGASEALKQFGQGVRAKRGPRSQRVVADRIGISINQYSNIERGINWPSMPVYLKICRVLRIALPGLLK